MVHHPQATVIDTISLSKLSKTRAPSLGKAIPPTLQPGDTFRALDALSAPGHTLLIPHAAIGDIIRTKKERFGVRTDEQGKWDIDFPSQASFTRPDAVTLAGYLEARHREGKVRFLTPKQMLAAGELDKPQGGIVIVNTDATPEPHPDGTYPLSKGHDSDEALRMLYERTYHHFKDDGVRIPLLACYPPQRAIVDAVSARYGRDERHSSAFGLNAAILALGQAGERGHPGALSMPEAKVLLTNLNDGKPADEIIHGMHKTGPTRFLAAYTNTPPDYSEWINKGYRAR